MATHCRCGHHRGDHRSVTASQPLSCSMCLCSYFEAGPTPEPTPQTPQAPSRGTLEPELLVVFDTLKGYGVDDPDAFIGLLHHWKHVKRVLAEMCRTAAGQERCPYCSDWHRRGEPLIPFRVEMEREPGGPSYYRPRSCLVHSPACPIGNLLLDLDKFFREDTIDACWQEAKLMHEEWKASEALRR
jgi:hypothetical protein